MRPLKPLSTAPNATTTSNVISRYLKAAYCIAASVDHLPPKGKQTVRYYEKDHGAHRATLASHQGMDPR